MSSGGEGQQGLGTRELWEISPGDRKRVLEFTAFGRIF